MTQQSSPRLRKLLSLAFVFLMAGLFACAPESNGEQADAANTPAAPGQPGTAPGPPARGAAPAAPQGQPGAAPGAAPADAPPLPPEKIPAVVAKINGEDIKKEDLLAEAERMQAQFALQMGRQVPLTSDFYRQVLDGMVAQHLLLQEAKAQGIQVSEEELNAEITKLRSRFPDEAAFKKAMAGGDMNEEKLRQELRKNATIEKLLAAKVTGGIAVTDQDAKAFYEQNKEQLMMPDRAHLRHILIKVDPQASAEDKQKARQKAESLLARLNAGEDFAKLAQEHSDDPGSKQRGGDLSWVTPGQTVEPFEKAAFALKANEISPVVESRFGFHIIQLLERKAPEVVPFDQVKDKISGYLKEQATGKAILSHVQGLKGKAKIETFI